MQLLFTKANWELSHLSVRDFVQQVAEAGYDGTEIYLPARPERTSEIRDLHEAADLKIVSHIATEGANADEHLRSLEQRYRRAAELQPLFINSHTGKDHFSFADSLRIFEAGERLVAEHGVPLLHETHRGRALFSAPAALVVAPAMSSDVAVPKEWPAMPIRSRSIFAASAGTAFSSWSRLSRMAATSATRLAAASGELKPPPETRSFLSISRRRARRS